MAKPRIFISSTYYDLKHVRSSLESFVKEMGYEPVLFESGDILFDPVKELDDSCYKEIESCHMIVLIVGGRYGSPDSSSKKHEKSENSQYDFYNSITRNEYKHAQKQNKPVMIFVESGVYSEYQTYKKNKENNSIQYAHVDNVAIFKLLDEIIEGSSLYLKTFEKIVDITQWLKDQWASMFCDYLKDKSNQIQLSALSEQLTSLSDITKTLKKYSESMLLSTENDIGKDVIFAENKILEEKILERFKKDDLIEHCLKYEDHKITAEDLFLAFKKSESFDLFIENAGYDSDFKEKHFHKEGLIRAESSYTTLRNALL
ncbi:DUF4062 domain-containing protein [Aeromonas veronii]